MKTDIENLTRLYKCFLVLVPICSIIHKSTETVSVFYFLRCLRLSPDFAWKWKAKNYQNSLLKIWINPNATVLLGA